MASAGEGPAAWEGVSDLLEGGEALSGVTSAQAKPEGAGVAQLARGRPC